MEVYRKQKHPQNVGGNEIHATIGFVMSQDLPMTPECFYTFYASRDFCEDGMIEL